MIYFSKRESFHRFHKRSPTHHAEDFFLFSQ